MKGYDCRDCLVYQGGNWWWKLGKGPKYEMKLPSNIQPRDPKELQGKMKEYDSSQSSGSFREINPALIPDFGEFINGQDSDELPEPTGNMDIEARSTYQSINGENDIIGNYLDHLESSLDHYNKYKQNIATYESILKGETDMELTPEQAGYYVTMIAKTQSKIDNIVKNKFDESQPYVNSLVDDVTCATRIIRSVLAYTHPALEQKYDSLFQIKKDNPAYYFETNADNYVEKMTNAINIVKNQMQGLNDMWDEYSQQRGLGDNTPKTLQKVKKNPFLMMHTFPKGGLVGLSGIFYSYQDIVGRFMNSKV